MMSVGVCLRNDFLALTNLQYSSAFEFSFIEIIFSLVYEIGLFLDKWPKQIVGFHDLKV